MNVRLACTGVLVLLVASTARAELRSVLISVKHDESRTATVGIRSDVKEEQKEGISIDEACVVIRQMQGWGSAVNVFVISNQYLGKADLKKLVSVIDDNIHTDLVYLRNGLPREWVDHFLGQLEVEVVEPSKRDDERHRAEADKNVSGVPSEPPGVDCVFVPVNTEKTLVEVVGKQFTDWTYPSDLLPDTFPGLEYVSGPGGPGVSGKGAWRKPVTLKHGPSGTEVFVNCYRRRKQPAQPLDPNLPGTPFLPLEEPDYQYQSAEFHALKAAAAGEKTRDVFVFLDGDILFKIEASGGSPEQRRQLVRSTAEAIWKFRHREDTATEGDDSSTRDSEKPRNPNGAVPGVGKAGGRPRPKITMQLSYAVSKPVPVPPAIAKLFREVVARPPARSLPERTFVAEWTALFRDADNVYEWYGNMLLEKNDGEQKCWGCPRLAVLWHRMMEQRANTDEKLAAALDEFERDLRQGKIPAQDKKTLRALEALGTVKRQLEQTVGGKWEVQTTDEHPLAPVLVGQVEVADTGRTHLAAYVVLPFPYDGLGRLAVWGQYRAGSHTFSVLGAKESLTVLGNMPSLSLPVSQDVMKTLGLTRPTITLEAMNTAEHLRRQREKLTVTLEWFGPGTGTLPAVRLTTSRAPAKAEPGWLVGQMSAFAARNLVDHFLEQGMLDPFDSANATPVRGPFCLMTIRAPAQPCSSEEVTLVNVLDWGQPLRKHLHAIREWLDGDARVAMDKLLEKLEKDEPPNTSTDPS